MKRWIKIWMLLAGVLLCVASLQRTSVHRSSEYKQSAASVVVCESASPSVVRIFDSKVLLASAPITSVAGERVRNVVSFVWGLPERIVAWSALLSSTTRSVVSTFAALPFEDKESIYWLCNIRI